ncbi:outer membrane protein transport protein [candidate division KSB1 bacterium]|nr:outer membrane protein transport protein [candidate division KSB1 bacterium]
MRYAQFFILLYETSIILNLPYFIFAQEVKNPSIAVLDLDANGISESEAKALSERLRIELFNTKKFQVIERQKMDEILTEQGFQQTGCTSTECLVNVGQLIGVQMMVGGSISRIDKYFSLSVRLIDVATGKILEVSGEDVEGSLGIILTQSLKKVAMKLGGMSIESDTLKTYIYITSDPEGANVYIDQKFYGVSPVKIQFDYLGIHDISLRMEGYEQWNKKLDIKKNQTNTVEAKLSKIKIKPELPSPKIFKENTERHIKEKSYNGFEISFINSATAGIENNRIGRRAANLGGNYRAISNDWSSMFWNPAGLVFTNGVYAGLILEYTTPSAGYTPASSPYRGQFSATYSDKKMNESNSFLLPAGGFSLSNGNVAFGLGFWAPFNWNIKWDLLNTNSYNHQYPEFDVENNLKIMDIHPTFSYKISNKFSIGVGAGILLADMMMVKPAFTPNPYVFYPQILTSIYTVGPMFADVLATMPRNALTSPYDHLLSEVRMNGDGISFGYNVGIMFKPTETFSIGGSARFYNNIKLNGSIGINTYYANFPEANAKLATLKPAYDSMLASGFINVQEYTMLIGFYSGSSVQQAVPSEIEIDLALPTNIGVGFSFTGINKLLLSADVAWTQWSCWDVIEINDKNTGIVYNKFTLNWKDDIHWGLGLEYKIRSESFIRGSFHHESAAAVTETLTPLFPVIGNRDMLILGIEVPVGRLRLHASAEKSFIKDMEVDKWIQSNDGQDYENWAGTYNMDVFYFMIGFDYRF